MKRTPALSSAGRGAVLIGTHTGHAVIAKDSPLARLNYFDGKFLRATDLSAEQQALLAQVQLVARAGGAGLVHGLDCALKGTDTLRVTPGTGLDWTGRPLVLSEAIELSVSALIEASAGVAPAPGMTETGPGGFGPCALPEGRTVVDPGAGATFYLVSAHAIEAYCGSEDVFGKLCAEACISDSQASRIVPGLCLRARPITLSLKQTQIALGKCQLRSRASSAYFEAERLAIPALVGPEGVLNPLWCLGSAAAGGDGIPLALLARRGTETVFVDSWAVRRERFEMPPAQYWAWRMAMRPRPVFWAQVAQFQCMLECCLSDGVPLAPDGGCDPVLTRELAAHLRVLTQFYAAAAHAIPTSVGPDGLVADLPDVAVLERQIARLEAAGAAPASDRILLDCGIVELPSAGYLPVAASAQLSVNRQVRDLLGPGVDLRFCSVRADFVPHALEEAQHMERIRLLEGLDEPNRRPEVDILVPGGTVLRTEAPTTGAGHRAAMGLGDEIFELGRTARRGDATERPIDRVRSDTLGPRTMASTLATARTPGRATGTRPLTVAEGAARTVPDAAGPTFFAAGYLAQRFDQALTHVPDPSRATQIGVWLELEMSADPATARVGSRLPLTARMNATATGSGEVRGELRRIDGEIRVDHATTISGGREIAGRLTSELALQTLEPDGGATSSTVPVTGQARLVLRSDADGRSEETLVLSETSLFSGLPGMELVLSRRWTGPGRQRVDLTARLSGESRVSEIALMQVDLDRDDAALRPGHPAHDDALRGIGVIATATNQPAQAELAEGKLFPPPAAPATTLELRATLPWVLFHRRRTKTCTAEPEASSPLPQRSYRLYNVAVTDDMQPAELQERIAAGQLDRLLQTFPPRSDGTVAFIEGQSNLATPLADMRADWEAVLARGSEVMAGVIASQGSVLNEGDTIAAARLAAVSGGLASVMPAAAGYGGLALGQVPAATATASLDGAILYFTRQSPALCHRVYRIATRAAEDTLRRLEDYFERPDDDLGRVLTGLGAQTLAARPRFSEDSPDFLTESDRAQLVSAWRLAGGGSATIGFSVSARRAAESVAAVAVQSTVIAGATGSALDLSAENHRTLAASRLGTCPRATILMVATQCTAIAYQASMDNLDRRIDGLVEVIQAQGLSESVFRPAANGAPILNLLDELDFLGEGMVDRESAAVLQERWATAMNRFTPIEDSALLAIARREADLPRARVDAEAVAATLGLNASRIAEIAIPRGSTLPVDCRTLTIPLIVAARR